MSASAPRWRLPVLLGIAAALCSGCNLMSLPYFLCPWAEYKQHPPLLCKLEPREKGGDAKVLLVAHAALTSADFVNVERELTRQLGRQLQDYYKQRKEKVTIVAPRQVERYQVEHPDWKESLEDMGKHFSADYVVYLEINSMSLYEHGSNTLYRGRAEINVSVFNMHEPDEDPISRDLEFAYPSNPIPVDNSTQPTTFRQAFLVDLGKKLARCFTPFPFSEGFAQE
jgi:hypothetical protein